MTNEHLSEERLAALSAPDGVLGEQEQLDGYLHLRRCRECGERFEIYAARDIQRHLDPETRLALSMRVVLLSHHSRFIAYRHMDGCRDCAEDFDALIAQDFPFDDEIPGDDVNDIDDGLNRAGNVRPMHANHLPFRAAASSAPPVGQAPERAERFAQIGDLVIARFPSRPTRFGLQSPEWAGKTLRITAPGATPIEAVVDRYLRFELSQQDTDHLVALLEGEAALRAEML